MRFPISNPTLAMLLFIFAVAFGPVWAAGSATLKSTSNQGIDTSHVRKLYQNGDFEPAIAILEEALRSRQAPEHRDSVFIYKHLGVMYAANEHTRERGKYFMMQLLTIEPTARIMDMYASDMIYMIFRNIQEEFTMNHGMPSTKNPSPSPGPDSPSNRNAPGSTPAKPGRGKTYAWVGAAAVAVGAGVTLYVMSNNAPSDTRKNHEVK